MDAKTVIRLRVDPYEMVHEAVERGVSFGLLRAFKHAENPPQEEIRESITREVMVALCEVLEFPLDEERFS